MPTTGVFNFTSATVIWKSHRCKSHWAGSYILESSMSNLWMGQPCSVSVTTCTFCPNIKQFLLTSESHYKIPSSHYRTSSSSLQDFLLICLEFPLIYGMRSLPNFLYEECLPENFYKIITSTALSSVMTPQLCISFLCIHLSLKLYENMRTQTYTYLLYRKSLGRVA